MGEDRVHIPEEGDAKNHITISSGGQEIIGSLDSTNACLRRYILADGEIQRMEGDSHSIYRDCHVDGSFAWDVV